MFNFYDLGTEEDAQFELLKGYINNSVYFVLASNRIYPTKLRLKDKYPIAAEFYEQLFDGSLGFELEASFTRPTLIEKITKRNVKISTSPPKLWEADESFRVFDSPTVLIFAKNNHE